MNDNNAHSYSEGDGVSPLEGYRYMGSENSFPFVYEQALQGGKKLIGIQYPFEITRCREAGHKLECVHTRLGYNKFICPTCRIWWDMDSGD